MAPAWTAALAASPSAVIAAFLWSQRPRDPSDAAAGPLPTAVTLVASLVATFAMTFGIYGLLLVNSFAFQQQRGASALETALWFLPMPRDVSGVSSRWSTRSPTARVRGFR